MKHIKLFEQFVEELNEGSASSAMSLIKAHANDEFHYSGYLGNDPAQLVFKAATGANKLPKPVYFDGQSIIVGSKTVAQWKKGMTVGQVFQLYAQVVQAAQKAAAEK